MATIKKFEDLECWKLARGLCKMIFDITKTGGLAKDFTLTNQMRRSSGSVMDNIPEGFSRGGNKEFIQFLSIARGSCSELCSQLYRCKDQGYISEEIFTEIYNHVEKTGKAISGMINYLLKSDLKGSKFKHN